MRARHGFTLLEILIAIAIIGILTAILAPRVTQYIEDSRIAAAKQELLHIKNALLSIRAKSTPPKYPSSLKAIRPYLSGGNFDENGQPLDPWGRPYKYEVFSLGGVKAQRYRLTSAGPDGIFGPNPQTGRSDDIILTEGSLQSQAGAEEDLSYEEEFQ